MRKNIQAFTIVELIVVIVVIGILSVVSVISYSGIREKTIISSLKSQASSDVTALKMYNTEYGSYPTSLDSEGCPTAPITNDKYCLKKMRDGAISFVGSDQSYNLTLTYGGVSYSISEDGTVSIIIGKYWKQVASGYYHTCAISSEDLVYCWGDNAYGQIGDNTTTDRQTPTPVNMANGVSALYGKTVKQISAGDHHTCVIANDNLVYCWGHNTYGQIGNNNSGTNRLVPTAVNMTNGVSALYGKTVKQVALGDYHTCALSNDNLAYCWGYNADGELGDNSNVARTVPTAVNTSNGISALYGKTVKQIAGGYFHTCVIANDNLVYCWGLNNFGQLGDNSNSQRLVPVAVNMTNGISYLYGKTVRYISVGVYNSCALADDNLVYCWGQNTYGQIGDNTTSARLVPTAVNMTNGISALYGKTVTQISVGDYHTCAIANDSLVYCWGFNDYGQLGDNTFGTNRLYPVSVNMTNGVSSIYDKTVKQISSGMYHSCALANDNSIHCWGYNAYGQIGDNTFGVDRLIPVASILPW